MGEIATPNLRQTERKILRCRVLVRLENGQVTTGKTLDISVGGLCVVLENSLPSGLACEVRLDFFVLGKPTRLQAKTRVMNCICTNQAYRIGLQFLNLEATQKGLITKLP